ncbi:TPA: hypothetical protein ACIECP_002272 [Enterococcus faecium]
MTRLQSEIPAQYVARLIRCHIRQREALLKKYGRRFIVSEENLLSESFNWLSSRWTVQLIKKIL